MDPIENSHQHRSSTLFTKKHTKGRLNEYNLYLFKTQKNNKKYILPDKPNFGSGTFGRYDTSVIPTGEGFTVTLS